MYLARSFAASSGSVVIVDTVGAGSAGGKGSAGGTATAGGAATVGGEAGKATTAGEGFKWLGGVLCDPRPNTFLRRLRNPLDSLAVCGGRWSVILMGRGDKKNSA